MASTHNRNSRNRRVFMMLVLCCLNLVTYAQQADHFSLQLIIQQALGAPDSIALARDLRARANDSIDAQQFDLAEQYLKKAAGIASRFGDQKLLNNIQNNLAQCYSATGRTQLAIGTYLMLLGRVENAGDSSSMATILINLGDEYALVGQLELAIETELRAITIKELSNNKRRLAFYYQKLGELFSDTDTEKWEYYIGKALVLSRKPEQTTWYTTIAIYNDLGAIWSKKHDYVKAAAYYDTMYWLSVDAGYLKGVKTATSERALMLFDQGRYAEALPLAQEAHRIVEQASSAYSEVYASNLVATILLKLNRAGEALVLLEPALRKAQRARLLPQVVHSLQKLVEANRQTGHWQKALEYQDQWVALKDSLDGVRIQQAMHDIQIRYETEKKQQVIDRLSRQNLIQRRLNNRLAGLLVASGFGLLMLVFLLRLRSRTIRQNKALHQQEQKILQLENQQMALELDYKARELTTATVHLINKNEVLNELKQQLKEHHDASPDLSNVVRKIDQNLNLDNDWSNFNRHFEKVHPAFFFRLKEKFPELTPNEMRLCAYLRINLNTKEISSMLHVTVAAVDKSRNRLRKKIGIAPDVNLSEFIAGI